MTTLLPGLPGGSPTRYYLRQSLRFYLSFFSLNISLSPLVPGPLSPFFRKGQSAFAFAGLMMKEKILLGYKDAGHGTAGHLVVGFLLASTFHSTVQ